MKTANLFLHLILALGLLTGLTACDQRFAFNSLPSTNKATGLNCESTDVKVIGQFTVEQGVPARWEFPVRDRVQWYIIFPDGERIFDGSILDLTLNGLGEYPGVVWGYDDCNTRQQQNFTIVVVPKLAAPTLTINDGAIYTRVAAVQLKLTASNADQMKISESPKCDSGSWEPFATTKAFTLSAEGADQRVYAQFKNAAATSECVSDGIVYDKTPPVMKFASVPAAQSSSVSAAFTFEVSDLVSGVKEFNCALDQESYQLCELTMTIPTVAYGRHSMNIRASDKAGNTTDIMTYQFERTNPAPEVKITVAPPASTTANVAAFRFVGEDDSKVEGYICSLDAAAPTACVSPKIYQNVAIGSHTFTVRAIDDMGLQSAPAIHKWTVKKEDPPPPVLVPPVVRLLKAPVNMTTDPLSIFEFAVDHPGVELKGIYCQLDGAAFAACATPKNYGALKVGKHSFAVYAVDENNLTSNKVTYAWEIQKARVPVNQTFMIDSSAKKLDVIVVIDNSPSMAEEQQKMADRFSTFISTLSNIDWQIGIITTDAREGSKAYQGGKLLPFEGLTNTFAIKSTTPNVNTVFGKTVKRKEWGSSTEEGIHSLLKSLTRPTNQFFFREHSHVASIIVSDEDERSNGTKLKTENQPENLVSAFAAKFGTKNTYSNHSIVLKADAASTKDCPQVGDYSAGETYMKLSRLTGGVIGNLCDKDYGQILKGIAENIRDRTYSALLTCVPDGPVNVKVTPAPATPIVSTVNGTSLTLTPYPALGSKVDVTYYCD